MARYIFGKALAVASKALCALALLLGAGIWFGCTPSRHSPHRLPHLFASRLKQNPTINAHPYMMKPKSLLCSSCRAIQPKRRGTKSPTLRIMTFNVNYSGALMRSVRAIVRAKADIVALQETTPAWLAAARQYLAKRYRYIAFVRAPGAGGMGFLSRYPVLAQKLLSPPSGGWFKAWLLRVQTPIGPLHIANVHLRPPLSENGGIAQIARTFFTTRPIRRRELQSHLHHILPTPANKRSPSCRNNKTLCLAPTVVLGDFNENYQGLGIRWLRKKRRMHSALRKFDRTSHTWEWPLPWWTLRSRLDHIMLSEQLQAHSARVLSEAGSDHFPVIATISLHK